MFFSREGAIDRLVGIYKRVLPRCGVRAMDILADCHHYVHCCRWRSFLSSLTQWARVQARHLASKHANMQANKHASKHANKHASKHANKHANRHASKQACKYSSMQTCKHARNMNVGAACSTDRQEFNSWTIATFMMKHLFNVLTVYLCKLNVGIYNA